MTAEAAAAAADEDSGVAVAVSSDEATSRMKAILAPLNATLSATAAAAAARQWLIIPPEIMIAQRARCRHWFTPGRRPTLHDDPCR